MARPLAAAFLLLLPTALALNFKLAGPYETYVRSLERCEDQGLNLLNFTTQLRKVSPHEYVYTGPWRWPYDVDNRWRVHLRADRWGAGGWGRNALSFDSKAPCADAKKMCWPMFKSAATAAGFPADCPIPKGNYYLNNWKMEISLPFRHLPYGRYRIEVDFLYDEKRIGCIRLVCDVEEKIA